MRHVISLPFEYSLGPSVKSETSVEIRYLTGDDGHIDFVSADVVCPSGRFPAQWVAGAVSSDAALRAALLDHASASAKAA